jgi:chromosome segregation ATPase
LYESEKFKLDDKIRTLEDKLAKVREERDQAQELASQRPPSPSSRARAAVSAAEIDNETLNAQVKHLQNKVNNLEEELDERRAELESEAESWKQKVQKVRDAEKIQVELVKSLRGEIGDFKTQTTSAKNRIGELEGALKETQAALEGARAEIESLRVEAAVCLLRTRSLRTTADFVQEATSMRSALQAASSNEKLLADRDGELGELRTKLTELEQYQEQSKVLEDKIASFEAEMTSVSQSDVMSGYPTKGNSSRQSMPTTPLPSMPRRNSVDSSTLFKSFLQRTQNSKRGPSPFSRRRLCSKRYVSYSVNMDEADLVGSQAVGGSWRGR